MSDEIVAAEIKARTVMAELEMNAMIAANKLRELNGRAQAYNQESFFYTLKRLEDVLERNNLL